jgi:hypothetical protein
VIDPGKTAEQIDGIIAKLLDNFPPPKRQSNSKLSIPELIGDRIEREVRINSLGIGSNHSPPVCIDSW